MDDKRNCAAAETRLLDDQTIVPVRFDGEGRKVQVDV